MNLSGRDAIAGLDIKLTPYAQIRWFTRDYSALRGENLFCISTPTVTFIPRPKRDPAVFAPAARG